MVCQLNYNMQKMIDYMNDPLAIWYFTLHYVSDDRKRLPKAQPWITVIMEGDYDANWKTKNQYSLVNYLNFRKGYYTEKDVEIVWPPESTTTSSSSTTGTAATAPATTAVVMDD